MKPLTLILPLALAACAPMMKDQPVASAPAGPCDATKTGDAIGKHYDEALGKSLMASTGSQAIRTIAPGQAVTMDYREDRLNVDLDAAGVVTAVRCG